MSGALNISCETFVCSAFQLYGPGAVFYKLSTVCLETVVGKYTYSMCPFGPVKQIEHGRPSVIIGSRVKWLDRGPDVYRLLLSNGDSTGCPGGRHRQTTVGVLWHSTDCVFIYYVHFSHWFK